MVIASQEITITFIRDILSTTRYYTLQPSTPSAPTTNPPPSVWDDTEPSYTGGGTDATLYFCDLTTLSDGTWTYSNSVLMDAEPSDTSDGTNMLYFCDLTVFSDGTWAYSDVSKSSSYEASKAAYDKAQEAQNTADSAGEDMRKYTDGRIDSVNNALEGYVQKDEYEEYKETVETEFSIQKSNIDMNFKTTTEEITKANGTTQSKFDEMLKYIRFSTGGIEIGSTESPLKLFLDNDKIKFMQHGQEIGYWDGNNFHTGNLFIDVTEQAQFGKFAFLPRSDGSLMFLKVDD